MKRHKFKLANILKLREFEEYQVRVRLGEINSKIGQINNLIQDYENYIKEIFTLQKDELKRGVTNARTVFSYAYNLKSYRSKIMDLKNKREKIEQEYNEVRKELIHKKNRLKIFQQLKDRDYEKYKKEMNYKENEEIEEIGNLIFSQKGEKSS